MSSVLPSTATTPLRLDLKKTEKLEIQWADGVKSVYSVSLLRTMCPCAMCKEIREKKSQAVPEPGVKKSLSLSVLPGNFSAPLAVVSAELVGNYALRIDWSDEHGSGIYSFQYLRELAANH